MKKKLIGTLCGAAVVAMAMPAFAEVSLSGTYSIQGLSQETSFGKDAKAVNFVAMRMRPKVTNKVNDLISIVYFGELDVDWGVDGSKGNGPDGALSGDGINLETKNMYVDLKPSKDFPLSFRAGLQGIADNLQNTYWNEDVAGLVAMGQFDALSLAAGWAKASEGTTKDTVDGSSTEGLSYTTKDNLAYNDDTDLYFVNLGFKVSDAVKVGLDNYYLHSDGTKAGGDTGYLMTIAPNVKATVAGIGLDAFLAYQFGTQKVIGGDDIKTAAYMGSIGAAYKLDPVNLGLRVIYYGKDGDDDLTKDKSFSGNTGGLAFAGEGLGIFLTDVTKTGTTGYVNDNNALDDAGQAGYGLLGITAKCSANFGPYFAKAAIGYFQALDDEKKGGSTREGKALGTELAAEVGMKIAEVATLSARVDYAMLGSFYDKTAGGEDPDNPLVLGLLLNIPF